MKQRQMLIIACNTLKNEIEMFKPRYVDSMYIESGYHRYPRKLREHLQSCIDEAEAEIIALGFGLCSSSLSGLQSKEKTLVIPRVHDCIGILLGSRERYDREFKAEPGTYYLSKGWIEELRDPYSEYLEYLNEYGENVANWAIELQYKNYSRLAFIYNDPSYLNEYRDYTKKVAEFLNIKYEEVKGANDYFIKLCSGDWNEEDFIIVPPGNSVTEKDFFKKSS